MFEAYQELVLRFYEKKQQENDLSLNLLYPTPAKIKRECLAVCSKRFSRKDGRVLEVFFGDGNDRAAIMKAIKKCETDKFKPLIKFLRKETVSTNENNIELLAWLIDFRPRPFELGKRYDLTEPDEEIIKEETEQPEGFGRKTAENPEATAIPVQPVKEEEPKGFALTQPNPTKPLPHFKISMAILTAAVLVFATVLIYLNTGSRKLPDSVMGNALKIYEACMYWAGDHYEAIPCKPKRGDTLVVELDSAKLFRFKKIADPKTITKDDIGRVAYIKLDGRREYYTDTGFHPVYSHKRLKPLTRFIYEKYILPLKQ